jgi:son of sevenless-like protein
LPRQETINVSRLVSPGRGIVQIPRIPYELAIALTLLEGDKYKVLVPFDYIAHLRKRVGHNNIEGAYATNDKIIFWVKDSLLHYDTVKKRANALDFFINTAQASRT